jgi:ComF family protein
MWKDFLDFLFPQNCACCEQLLVANEEVICTLCRNDLPLTDSHLSNENPVKKLFYGRARIENAMALLVFQKKGITQHLMHSLKYKGNEEVGAVLGNWVAENLKQTRWHSKIEAVVPVPLHKKRLRERGYNQVEGFGKTIASALKTPFNNKCLIKTHAAKTQVFKNLAARFKNVEHSFRITEKETEKAKLKGKHILLVDDIITTGATLETCANRLLEIPGTKVSIAAMATTR